MPKWCWLLPVLLVVGCDMSAPTKSSVTLPEPGSPGVQMMKEFCASCHAPPSPATHTAKEWPNVIYRMQERRRMEAYELMNDEQQKILLDYLTRNAKA